MARIKRDSLLYFPFDVDFFGHKKIRKLRRLYGTKGITMYLYILCTIYSDKGYYTVADDDFFEDLNVDTEISENAAREIITYLCKRAMLDSNLFASVKVLTSHTIQQTYQEAKRGAKRDIKVNSEYWLLSSQETLSFIKCCQNSDISKKNDDYSEKNDDYSEKKSIKESKRKESKEKYICSEQSSKPPVITLMLNDKSEYPITEEYLNEMSELYPNADVLAELRKMRAWLINNPKRRKTKSGITRFINTWLSKEQDKPQKYVKQEQTSAPAYYEDFEDYEDFE